jgi:hypothetical protein
MSDTTYQVRLGAQYGHTQVYAPYEAAIHPMAARNRHLERTIHTWIDFLIDRGLAHISDTWVEVLPARWHLNFELADVIRESARSLPSDYAQQINPTTLEYDRLVERVTNGVCSINRNASYKLLLKVLAEQLANGIALRRLSEVTQSLSEVEVFEKIDTTLHLLEQVLSARVRIIPESEDVPYLLSTVNAMEYFLSTRRRSSLIPLTMEAAENYGEFRNQLETLRNLIKHSCRITISGDFIAHAAYLPQVHFTISRDSNAQYEMDISAVPLGDRHILFRTSNTGVVNTNSGPRLGMPMHVCIRDDNIRVVLRSPWPTPILASPPPKQFLSVPPRGSVILVGVLESDLYLSPLAISINWQHPLQLVLGLSALCAQIIDRDYRLIKREQSKRPGYLDRLLTAIAMRCIPCRSLTLEQFLTALWAMSQAQLNPTMHAAPILLEGLSAAEQHKAFSIAEYWEAEREMSTDQLDYHIFEQRYETLNAITILSRQEPEESWYAQPLNSGLMSC